jgi:hypothetical protein
MNNAGFLAEDFQQIKTKSDDLVFELLKNRDGENNVKKTSLPKQQRKLAEQPSPNKVDRPTVSKSPTPAMTSKPKKVEPKQWGKPVALFNTRIPQELSNLLDDLVYRSKKDGTPITKQAIAIAALAEFVKTNGLMR